MDPGLFSVGLTVSDLGVSRDFYQKLGFEVTCDELDQGHLILKNGTVVIGLFHGMFERNILTFNPELTVEATKPRRGRRTSSSRPR